MKGYYHKNSRLTIQIQVDRRKPLVGSKGDLPPLI